MALGVCCQWLEPYTKRDGSVEYINSIEERTLQLGRFKSGAYSRNLVRDVYHNNVREIIRLVPKLITNNIRLFRLSSGLFPLFEFNEEMIKDDEVLINLLRQAGHAFISAGIRVTTHPGQFTVLSSDNKDVVKNAVQELTNHAWVFDTMGLPQTAHAAINIHGGKRDRLDQLVSGIRALPDNARNRLTLENDETCYNLVNLLQAHDSTGVPIVWDSHHHKFNDGGLTLDEAYELATATWSRSSCKPLQHLSNTEDGSEGGSFTERRKHSLYIRSVPLCQREGLLSDTIDVDIEAKAKNLAVLKFRNMLESM
jgi:UV DNA damage endonuclease